LTCERTLALPATTAAAAAVTAAAMTAAAVTAAAVTAAAVTAAAVTAAAVTTDAAGEWDSAPARAGEVPSDLVPSVLVLLVPVHRRVDLVLAPALTPAAPSAAKTLQHQRHDTPA
jgi:hypothetical protein